MLLLKRQRILCRPENFNESGIAAEPIEFRFGTEPNQPRIMFVVGRFQQFKGRVVIAERHMGHPYEIGFDVLRLGVFQKSLQKHSQLRPTDRQQPAQ